MKPGLIPGKFEEFTILVTPEMTPHFDGRLVHPVYATWWLVQHMELAGRRVLVPHLEHDEEGVGGGISVEHRGPALVGTRVTIRATVESCERDRLVCATTAHAGKRLLAFGTFLQVIMPKAKLEALLRRSSGDVEAPELMPAAFRSLLEDVGRTGG